MSDLNLPEPVATHDEMRLLDAVEIVKRLAGGEQPSKKQREYMLDLYLHCKAWARSTGKSSASF